jgi:hypothetical protein
VLSFLRLAAITLITLARSKGKVIMHQIDDGEGLAMYLSG